LEPGKKSVSEAKSGEKRSEAKGEPRTIESSAIGVKPSLAASMEKVIEN